MAMDSGTTWDSLKKDTEERLRKAAPLCGETKIVPAEKTVALLEALIRPGDRVCLEGDTQKQPDFLAECLCKVDPETIHDLHIIQSVLSLPAHLDIFEKGIAKKSRFCIFGAAGRPSGRLCAGWEN
jgi:malonate decarboxylase alpha subunit